MDFDCRICQGVDMPRGHGRNILAGLFYEFSIPLGLCNLIQTVAGNNQTDPNSPVTPTQRAPREWYSQPRPCSDTTTEVITVNFKLPLSIGQLGFQALRVPCVVSAWYRDRNNNWIPLTDDANTPISINLSYSAATNWYHYQTNVYPVVAAAMQLRIQRKFDAQMGNSPYVVGIKETLIRRNAYALEDTRLAIEDQQDALGNNIKSYVKVWDANNVIDNNSSTFWKSFPCPDPNGVVALYLDTRDQDGSPQLIDTVYIDPVYAGNVLNFYYSNDPTQGTSIISAVSLPPDTQINSTWTQGTGMVDTSGPDLSISALTFRTAFGPLVQQPTWIGIEWIPNFDPSDGPPDNPILFTVNPIVNTVQIVTVSGSPTGGNFTLAVLGEVTSGLAYNISANGMQTALEALSTVGSGNVLVASGIGGGGENVYQVTFQGSLAGQSVPTIQTADSLVGDTLPGVTAETVENGFTPPYLNENTYWPTVYYDVGAGYITLEFSNGTTTHDYHVSLSPAFIQYAPLQIVVGWSYDPSVVFVSVTSKSNVLLGSTTVNPASDLPNQISMDGEAGYQNFRGTMTALVVKQDLWSNGYQAFQAAPTIYTNPNPVQPDANGNYPSTSLDNAILAVDWTSQEFPIGGTHESWYENKTWTPIFANYVTKKGNLFLPQAVSMSYLKMEFTNLTAEPYPVYDQGIPVSYYTFPAGVAQAAAAKRVLALGGDIPTNSVGSVNWLNPSTIQNAINSNWGVTQQPIQVVTGPGTLTTSLPNAAQANISNSYRSEQSNPWIYSRKILNPSYLAGQQLTQISNSPTSAQTLQSSTDGSTSTQVGSNFAPVTTTSSSNVLPIQGQDWWLFPGANLKLPASVMRALTGTQVVTSRAPSLATRTRFTTTCVHRYNINRVTLDAPVAYFAGVSEVQPYLTSYIATNDPPSFSYSQYDPGTFVYDNIYQEVTGPLTTKGSPYVFQNPEFLYPLELSPWTTTGNWYWDSQHGPGSQNGLGDVPSAAIVADGNNNTAISEPLEVSPGDEVVISALVAYYGASSSAGGALSISGVTYHDGTEVDTVELVMPTTTTTYRVSTKADMLALSASIGDSCTITDPTLGGEQGTYYLLTTPASTFSNWTFTGYGTMVSLPSGNIDGRLFIRLSGTYTVPGSGVDQLAVSLNVNEDVTTGNTYWSDVKMDPADGIEGTVFLNAVTTSTFSDVTVKVSDSGLVTSDAMWARADPLDTNINNLQLAPYVNTIPSIIPSGMWADTFATWGDASIEWGEPLSEVAINVDPNLIFDGDRAVHFTRAAGAGEAGVLITQQTFMVPQALARLKCVFLKPVANSNQITVRLRRVSDGLYIHEETFTPTVGYWYTYLSAFFELPNTIDQVYTIEFVATGDEADEIYLSNLTTQVAGIRYFLQLGDSSEFLFDITPLAYGDNCSVSCTTPVNEMSLTVGVFSDAAFAYGVSLVPRYLK